MSALYRLLHWLPYAGRVSRRVRRWLATSRAPPAPEIPRNDDVALDPNVRERSWSLDELEATLREHGTLPPAQADWLMRNYEPLRMQLPVTETGGRLVASYTPASRGRISVGSMRPARRFQPTHYQNPHQGLDDFVIEAVSTGTFWQSCMNFLMQMVMGKSVRPKIILKNPDPRDYVKNRERLEELKWIEETLAERDRLIGPLPGDRVGRQTFFDLVQELVRCAMTYNRGCLRIARRGEMEYRGVRLINTPVALQFVHGRELGMIETDDAGDLKWTWWNLSGQELEWPEMVYLWNSVHGEQRSGTKWYGNTPIDAVLNDLRLAYHILSVHAPAAARALYGGTVIIPVDLTSLSDSRREREMRRITSNLVQGGYSVIARNPADVDVKPVQTNVRPEGLVELLRHCYMSVAAALGVPISMVFDESASNRATLSGKMVMAMKSTVQPIRDWVNREIAPQWYGEALQEILASTGNQGLAAEIDVIVEFDDTELASEEKVMEGVKAIAGLVPISDRGILRMAGKEEYIDEIDEEKRQRMEDQGMMFGAPGDDGGAFGGRDEDGEGDGKGDKGEKEGARK